MNEESTGMVVGVDAGKGSPTVWTGTGTVEIPNRARAIRSFLSGLPGGCRLGVEATGRYHERLVGQALALGLTVYVLNPREVRGYKDSPSFRAKTDRLDCEFVARFVEREADRLIPYAPPPRRCAMALSLLRLRDCLVRSRAAAAQSLQALPPSLRRLVAPSAEETLRVIQARLEELEALVDRLGRGGSAYRRSRAIPGVGTLTAAALSATLDSRAFASSDAFVAFCGLDLRVAESGTLKGRRRLSRRGDPLLRKLLYLAAAALARSKAGRNRHAGLVAKGMHRVAALVDAARRIARLAWSLHRHEADFDPAKWSVTMTEP